MTLPVHSMYSFFLSLSLIFVIIKSRRLLSDYSLHIILVAAQPINAPMDKTNNISCVSDTDSSQPPVNADVELFDCKSLNFFVNLSFDF